MARKTKRQLESESGEGVYRYETFSSEFWDWAARRIPDAPVQVSPKGWTNKQGEELPSRKLGESMGHSCPACPGTLCWGNGGPFIWSLYMLWCPSCYGAWHANHKYIWGLIQEVLKDQGIVVEDTREEVENEDSGEGEATESEGPTQLEVCPTPDTSSGEPEKKRRKRKSKESD